MPLRVLVVDDYAPWRQQIAEFLHKTGEWLVIGEAADGPDAVALAAATVPDLTLLDLQLPTLSGIDAAARIRAANPSSRILHLTGHRSWDVVEAALVGGARGYVLKPYAALELLPAMAAVVKGRRFVSTVLGGRPLLAGGQPTPHVHEAAFHQGERTLLTEYEAFAAGALSRGKGVIGIGDASRHHALVQGLRLRGIDVERAIEDGRFRMLDTVDLLRQLMVDGAPDETRYWEGAMRMAIGAASASRADPPAIAVFGDGVQRLFDDGHIEAAIRLERLWEDFARTFNVEILCGFMGRLEERAFDAIRSTHTSVHTR